MLNSEHSLLLSIHFLTVLGVLISSTLFAHVLVECSVSVLIPIPLHSFIIGYLRVRKGSHGVATISGLLHLLSGGESIGLHAGIHLREEESKDTLSVFPLEIV